MKKLFLILLINLMIPMNCFSDTISVDTLKLINIIFVDRDRLEKENSLLKKEVESYKDLEKIYNRTDSLKTSQINAYADIVKDNERSIKRLKKSRTGIVVGSGALLTLLLILGLIK